MKSELSSGQGQKPPNDLCGPEFRQLRPKCVLGMCLRPWMQGHSKHDQKRIQPYRSSLRSLAVGLAVVLPWPAPRLPSTGVLWLSRTPAPCRQGKNQPRGPVGWLGKWLGRSGDGEACDAPRTSHGCATRPLVRCWAIQASASALAERYSWSMAWIGRTAQQPSVSVSTKW
jgi:hypothetical protein